MFILVSSVPDLLLPTVRSRCPRLRLGGLSAADVTRVLMRDHGYAEAEARGAGHRSRTPPRRVDSERSMRAFGAVDRALGALERNAGPKVVADWLVLWL